MTFVAIGALRGNVCSLQNCATDNSRKRRSVSDYEDFDALYTMLEIEDDEGMFTSALKNIV